MSERSGEFAAFRAELASGTPASQSWKETLPDLAPERLDALLDAYAKRASLLTLSRQTEAPATEPRVRALSDADVYTLRAELYSSCAGCSAESEQKTLENLQAALQAEPGHVRASVLLAQRTGASGLADARALVQRHPEAWLAWLNLARAQSDPRATGACDAEVVPKLAATAPNQPYALMASALCELRAGHGPNALELSARALSLAPNDVELATLRAGVLRSLGQCLELASIVSRVRSAAHTRVAPDQLGTLAVCSETPVARE
jgi:Flp pilus assembly protein TadD